MLVRDFLNTYFSFYWRQNEFHIVFTMLNSTKYRKRVKEKLEKDSSESETQKALDILGVSFFSIQVVPQGSPEAFPGLRQEEFLPGAPWEQRGGDGYCLPGEG